MIVEDTFNGVASLLLAVLDFIPTLRITIPSDLLSWFSDLINAVAWFFPISDVFLIFGIWVTVTNFNLLWKLIQRVWDALPFT